MADSTGNPLNITENQYSKQAFQSLGFGFTVAPILAGLDKFFHLLVNWDQYLAPFANNLTGGRGHQVMLVVGVIEIAAGYWVFFLTPTFFFIVVALVVL